MENDQIVSDLRDALRDGRSGLSYVPKLLEAVLDRDAWRSRTDEDGAPHPFRTFDEFTDTPPLAGLGASPALIDRIVGTDKPDLLIKLRHARRGKPGRPRKGKKITVDSTGNNDGAGRSDLTAGRLARDAPDEYDAVRRGEKTINAAAISAGIRPHRISVRPDRPESVARTLRKHMTPDQLIELARLLTEET